MGLSSMIKRAGMGLRQESKDGGAQDGILAVAAVAGNVRTCEECLAKGANPNQEEGGVPLLVAAMGSRQNGEKAGIARVLTRAGANLEARGPLMRTALMTAARECDDKAVGVLLEGGAEAWKRDSSGLSAADLALWGGGLPSAASMEMREAALALLLKSWNGNERDLVSMMNVAARYAPAKMLGMVLEAGEGGRGKGLFLSSENGEPAARGVLACAVESRDAGKVGMLLKNEAFAKEVNESGPSGMTPLMKALTNEADGAACALLDEGAFFHSRSGPDERTPLDEACARGLYQAARKLLGLGAGDAAGDGGESALKEALRHDKAQVARMFIREGAVKQEAWMLDLAAGAGALDSTVMLLEMGLNAPSALSAALVRAAKAGSAEIARALINAGAVGGHLDESGKNARDYADASDDLDLKREIDRVSWWNGNGGCEVAGEAEAKVCGMLNAAADALTDKSVFVVIRNGPTVTRLGREGFADLFVNKTGLSEDVFNELDSAGQGDELEVRFMNGVDGLVIGVDNLTLKRAREAGYAPGVGGGLGLLSGKRSGALKRGC